MLTSALRNFERVESRKSGRNKEYHSVVVLCILSAIGRAEEYNGVKCITSLQGN